MPTIPARPRRLDRKLRAYRLLAGGQAVAVVARRVGVSRMTVYRWRHAAGLAIGA